jgi:hypothetical protein
MCTENVTANSFDDGDAIHAGCLHEMYFSTRTSAQAVSYALRNLTSPAVSPDRHHFQPQSVARNLHLARRRIAISQYVTRKLKRPNGAAALAFLIQPFTASYKLHTVAQTPEVHEIRNYPETN